MTMAPVQLSLEEGLDERNFNLALLEHHYPRFLDRARALAVTICRIRERTHGEGWVTADDIRAILPIPPDVHPNTMGAVFCHSMFRFLRWERSSQPQRHASKNGVWALRDGSER